MSPPLERVVALSALGGVAQQEVQGQDILIFNILIQLHIFVRLGSAAKTHLKPLMSPTSISLVQCAQVLNVQVTGFKKGNMGQVLSAGVVEVHAKIMVHTQQIELARFVKGHGQ